VLLLRRERCLKRLALNATEKALLMKALRTNGAVRRATGLALSPTTSRILKRSGIPRR
jgi:hypothetical protein